MIGQRALRRLMDPNLNLSPSSRTVVVHVATCWEEWVEIGSTTLERLLHVRDRRVIRRAISDAVDAGWLEYNPHTGYGHSPQFRFCEPGAEDNRAENALLDEDNRAENAQVTDASRTREIKNNIPYRKIFPTDSTSSSSAGVGAGAADEVATEVREYLGSDAVDLALSCGFLTPPRLAGLYAMYGPGRDGAGGTQAHFWTGISPPDQRLILATALQRFAMDADRYSNPLFESYLRRARTPDDSNSSSSGRAGPPHSGAVGRRRHDGRVTASVGTAAAARGQRWVEE